MVDTDEDDLRNQQGGQADENEGGHASQKSALGNQAASGQKGQPR